MCQRYGPERGEVRLARHPACSVQVSWLYKQFADSGDEMMCKQGIAIFDRCVPAIAMPLDFHSHKSRIFLVGHYWEARPLASPGLHCIGSVTSHYLLIKSLPVQRCTRFSAVDKPSER